MDKQPSLRNEERVKLLFAEDSRSEAAIVRARLSQVDEGRLAITTVASFAELLQALDTQDYDVLLLDLGLPDSEGSESIATLSKHFPRLPIVILSGHEEEVAVMRSLNYGAEEFLIKGQATPEIIFRALMKAIFRKSLHKTPDKF